MIRPCDQFGPWAAGLAADPISTACKAELRRIGHAYSDPAADPDRVDARETVITAAWAGLPPQPGGA